jgi:hypothetical protein
MTPFMKKLNLSVLEDGSSTGLSVRAGGFLAEAASVCLDSHRHPMEVLFAVEGVLAESYQLTRLVTDALSAASFGDMKETAEYGAMGIAVALIYDQKGWKVKRSWIGTGFDYWVGEETDSEPFQNRARLEVSGNLEGADADLRTRLNKKLKQTDVSAGTGLPAYAIIVGFRNPKTLTGKR